MEVRNVIVISDTHFGCQMGLCPPEGAELDGGGRYQCSRLQLVVWSYWNDFWNRWVPMVTRGEPYALVHNGDVIDGSHHRATTQISQNIKDQRELAIKVLTPIVAKADGGFYMTRGTSVHSGESGCDEETIARELGAIPSRDGLRSRNDLWLKLPKCHLVHFLHHIGTTGSSAYETTAILKELVEEFNEAARWGDHPPHAICRSHRHSCAEVRVPAAWGEGISWVTPGWQLKTPFAYRIPGARLKPPQIGGSFIRVGDEDLYTRHYVRTIGRTEYEEPTADRKVRVAVRPGSRNKKGGKPGRHERGRTDKGHRDERGAHS